MKKKFSFDYVLAILWGICLILDIVRMAEGGEPHSDCTNMLMAHICLILAHLRLGMKDSNDEV